MEKQKNIDIKIKKKYEKSSDFRKYYVTGALGGFKNPYDFRLSFFTVDSNEFLIQTQKFKELNLSYEEISKTIAEMEMPYEIQCEVIMTEQAVRDLHNFIGKELKVLEEIQQKAKK